MDVDVSVIVLFSRTEGKYMPQDKRSKEEIAPRAPENESNVLNKFFHFRCNLHPETSCEWSLGGIWILEKYGKGPVHTYPGFRLETEIFFFDLAYRPQVFGETVTENASFQKNAQGRSQSISP